MKRKAADHVGVVAFSGAYSPVVCVVAETFFKAGRFFFYGGCLCVF